MLKRYHVEFVDSDTHTIFHTGEYASLKAVHELVTMWGNCYTVITDMKDPDETVPVSGWWVAAEFAKIVSLPMIIILGSLWFYWHKAEIVTWMSALSSTL